MKKAAPLLAGIFAQVLFGFTMLFIKRGMAIVHQDTIKYLAFRFVTGFLCMTLLIALGICKVNFRGKNLKYAIICGLCNPLVSQVLETSSTRFAPTAQIAMLSSICPIVVVVLGVVLFHEKVSRAGVGFCLLSVFGVFIMRTVLFVFRSSGNMTITSFWSNSSNAFLLTLCTSLFT